MSGDGRLGREVQRANDEMRSWPAWAQPYRPSVPDVREADRRSDGGQPRPAPDGAPGKREKTH